MHNNIFISIPKSADWGRRTLHLLLALALVATLLLPMASSPLPALRLQPLLLQLAAERPDATVGVIVQKTAQDDSVEEMVAALGGTVTKDLRIINAFVAEMSAAAARSLAASSSVRWVSLDAPVESVSDSTVHTYYLHNDPFPAQGDTASHATLPLSETAPTTETLYNYDIDRDAFPGQLIQKGGDADRTDLTKIQHWRLASTTTALQLSGQVQLTIYSAMKDLNTSKTGEMQVFLVDWNGEQASTIAGTTLANASWNGGWQAFTIDFGSVYYTVAAGHQLGVSVVVNSTSDDDMWIAYGTTAQPSVLTVTIGAVDPSSQITHNTFLDTLSVRLLWEMGLNGKGVTVAVIDSGITSTADFSVDPSVKPAKRQSRILDRLAFSSGLSASDNYGHGTHIAGIIGGNGANSNGLYAGIAPQVNLLSLNISNSSGMAYESDTVAAMQWVLDNKDLYKIRVVNLSINSSVVQSYHTSPLDAAAEILWFNGIVVVVSAGNNGTGMYNGILSPPANDPFVITVGASDETGTADPADDIVAPFSAAGVTSDGVRKPDIIAPGRNIISVLAPNSNWSKLFPERALGDGKYFRISGTSMAAPMVAGAVALMLQREPSLTPDQVKYRLISTGTSISGDTSYPYLDVYQAATTATTQSANTGLQTSQLLWTGSEPLTWSSVNWNSVNWNSVNWNSVNWNSVNWNSVNWNSVNWNDDVWDD